MAKVERFEDLRCWQKGRELTNSVYRISREGALPHDYRLRSQLTRAAISTMTNIAEGFSRYHRGDFIRFLDFAQSSAAEVRSLLYVVLDQRYARAGEVQAIQEESDACRRMILGLLKHVRNSRNTRPEVREKAASYRGHDVGGSHYALPPQFINTSRNKPRLQQHGDTKTPKHPKT